MHESDTGNMKESKLSSKEYIREFAANSSFGGVPNVERSKSYVFKTFWTLLVLTGTGVTIWQVALIFISYYSYPVTISFNMTSVNEVVFPTITICNANMIRKSKAYLMNTSAAYNLLNDTSEGDNVASFTNSRERTMMKDDFDYFFSLIDHDARVDMGHQLDTMLLDCSFGKMRCDSSNFSIMANSVQGNCFIFNSGWNGVSLLYSYIAGPTQGLSLELYIEQDEYVADLSESAGLLLSIHSNEAMPFPEVDGVLVPPNAMTNIGITHRIVNRLESPYASKCTQFDDKEELVKENVFSELYPVGYTFVGCRKTCIQKYLYKDCGCGDPLIPIKGKAFRQWMKERVEVEQACQVHDEVQAACKKEVYELIYNGSFQCNCTPACMESLFYVTSTSHQWPCDAYKNSYYAQLVKRNPQTKEMFEKSASENTDPGRNLVKLKIFYSDLTSETVTEEQSYTTEGLFSDLGGTLGLYLGISFIALFEIVEIIIRLCGISCEKKEPRKSQVDNKN